MDDTAVDQANKKQKIEVELYPFEENKMTGIMVYNDTDHENELRIEGQDNTKEAVVRTTNTAYNRGITKLTTVEWSRLEVLFSQCYVLGQYKSKDGQSITVKVKDMHKRLKEVGGEDYKFYLDKKGTKLSAFVSEAFEGKVRKSNSAGVPVFWGLCPL